MERLKGDKMRFRQFLGYIFYYGIGKHLPKSSSFFKLGKGFRRMCGKLLLEKCGKKVNIEKGAVFSRKCTLGNFSGIGVNAEIGVAYIGNNVMMGPNCKIISQNHCFEKTDIPMCQQGNGPVEPVTINDDVWIGSNVIILPGCEIGEGCVIGAGSVVTKSTPPYSICCGNPAVVKKYRKKEKEL